MGADQPITPIPRIRRLRVRTGSPGKRPESEVSSASPLPSELRIYDSSTSGEFEDYNPQDFESPSPQRLQRLQIPRRSPQEIPELVGLPIQRVRRFEEPPNLSNIPNSDNLVTL